MPTFRDAIHRGPTSVPSSSSFAEAMRQARSVQPTEPSEKKVLQALQVLLTQMVR